MAVQFHTLKIFDVWHDTPDTVAISLEVPEELKPVFLYKHGPSWLKDHVKPGLTREVYPPMGNFTKDLHHDHARHYLLIAGGSGITPVLSIMKSILRVEPLSVVTLFYSNRNEASIIFDKEITSITAAHPDNCRVVHILEESADSGRIFTLGRLDHDLLTSLIDQYAPTLDTVDAFVCGPQAMMDGVIADLHAKGLADVHIHREYFTLSKDTMETNSQASAGTEAPGDKLVTRMVRIRLYGKEFEFPVEPDETILSAAQRADLDPPYACQIGACCTCRAKLVSGTAMMDEREALSDDEIADGYVLTCQTHPTSDGVFADYDQ
ncbi:MAG: 2Fe-2S iron-sulfur cluster-binding protein [Candidatus Kapabacteria bacterium]|nr:2Fe-2S iron-sulfur cluster-binding protein [Candidatus Kapabacteria bacterium]